MKVISQYSMQKNILLLFMSILPFGLFAQESATTENSLLFTEDDANLEWGPCPEFLPEGCAIAVLHGNPAEPNADIFFKVPANSEIATHTHTSAERMVLISGELEVTYEGEQTQILRPGSYAYGPAGKPHSAKCGDTPCVLFIGFEEPVDAIPVTGKN